MSSNLLRVVQEQQETIEKQSRLIADLIATLESWEQTASYDGAGRIYEHDYYRIY